MTLATELKMVDGVAILSLRGEVTSTTAPLFQTAISQIPLTEIQQLILDMEHLSYLSSAGLRVLIFAKQKMGSTVEISITGASELIVDTLKKVGFHHSIYLQPHP